LEILGLGLGLGSGGSKFGVWGLGFGSLELAVLGSGVEVSGKGLGVCGLWFRFEVLGCRVPGAIQTEGIKGVESELECGFEGCSDLGYRI